MKYNQAAQADAYDKSTRLQQSQQVFLQEKEYHQKTDEKLKIKIKDCLALDVEVTDKKN
jgi:hypothetical protein